jgi:beta-ribofuranosylaminobenzene 5'-phosphate synthase
MKRVEIETGARLHFGLVCAGQQSAGNFGGIGLMIRSPGWKMHLQEADDDRIAVPPHCPDDTRDLNARILAILQRIRAADHSVSDSRYSVSISRIIPAHCGLGAGTQLALSIATAIHTLQGLPRISANRAAAECRRAQRSAVGTHGFETGGLLDDSGNHVQQSGGQRVRSHPIPDTWRFVIVRRRDQTGISGSRETAVFRKQLQMKPDVLTNLRTLIDRQIVPAAEANNFGVFSSALATYGRCVGNFFATEQGSCFADPQVHVLTQVLRQHDLPEPVQSSWGPAVAIPANSVEHAVTIQKQVRSVMSDSEMHCEITEAMPHGASVRTIAPESTTHRTRG